MSVLIRTLCILALLAGCATSKPTVYNLSAIRAVHTWNVDFIYESGRTEDALSKEKGSEFRVIREGRPKRELKLRDDIAYLLKDKYRLSVTRTAVQESGSIRLLAVDFLYGGFRSADVELVLPNGEIAARITVRNGDRNATTKDDDEFAEYIAEAIADVLRPK